MPADLIQRLRKEHTEVTESDGGECEATALYREAAEALEAAAEASARPIDMVLHCPACGLQHVDEPDWVNDPQLGAIRLPDGEQSSDPVGDGTPRQSNDEPVPLLPMQHDAGVRERRSDAAQASDRVSRPTQIAVHRSHLCRPEDGGCQHIWRPADVATNGVRATKTHGKNDSPVRARAGWRRLAEERFAEIERARGIIGGLTLYRERLLTLPAESTVEMRARIRELAIPPRDDFDSAVLALLCDYEALLTTTKAGVDPLPPSPEETSGWGRCAP